MNKKTFALSLVAAWSTVAGIGAAQAALSVSGSIGGAPTGVVLDNLNWLALGSAGGVSPQSGITVNLTPGAQAVTGSVGGQYAAPFLSGGNGTGFGDPIGTNQPNGVNSTVYLTSGSTGAAAASLVEILLPANGGVGYQYFGLLWGSVDAYNTLSFFDGNSLVGSITGSDVTGSPNGDQGVNGTLYVNITSTDSFNRVLATSSQFAFEFDNIAFNERIPVSEPGPLALLGLGLLAAGLARRSRRA